MNSNTNFKVSVIVCAYNAGRYLPRAIESILNQTLAPNEIIIVDDGSTDDTKAVINAYKDAVRYIYQDNAGPGSARNTGIKAACSEWIAFLDADDEWLPETLQYQSHVIEHHPDLQWVSGNYIRCLCDMDMRIAQSDPQQIKKLLHGNAYYEDFLEGFALKIRGCMGTMLIRRQVLLETGLFKAEWKLAEDIDLWLRIAYRYPRAGFVVEPLVIYHMETGQSLSRKPMDAPFLEMFLTRHLRFAQEAGRMDSFKPYAVTLLRSWIRSAKFDNRIYDVRGVSNVFGQLLSNKDKAIAYCLTIMPGLTRWFFCGLSKLSRLLKLRRQTWHPTDRYHRRQKIV